MTDRFAVLSDWMMGLVLFSAAAVPAADRVITDAAGRQVAVPSEVAHVTASGPGALRQLTYLECLDCVVGVDILRMDLGKALHQLGHWVTQIHEVADPSARFGHGQGDAQRFKLFGLLAMFMVNQRQQRQDVDKDIPGDGCRHLRIHFH